MKRHPMAIEWERFKREKPTLFDGSTKGEYLNNRLYIAFNCGWHAHAARIDAALKNLVETEEKDEGCIHHPS